MRHDVGNKEEKTGGKKDVGGDRTMAGMVAEVATPVRNYGGRRRDLNGKERGMREDGQASYRTKRGKQSWL